MLAVNLNCHLHCVTVLHCDCEGGGQSACQTSHMEQMFQSNQALRLWPFYCINIEQIRWA